MIQKQSQRCSPLLLAIMLAVFSSPFSCAPKETNESATADSLSSVALVDTPATVAEVIPAKVADPYNGVVMSKVLLRADSSEGETPGEEISYSIIKILDHSIRKEPSSSDCAAYYWYKVETASGKTGWLRGSELKRKASAFDNSGNNKGLSTDVNVRGKKYYLDGAVSMDIDFSTGPSCSIPMIPFLSDDQNNIYPVGADESMWNGLKHDFIESQEGILTMTFTSDGGSANIYSTAIEKDGTIALSISHSFQEGGFASELRIAYNKVEEMFYVVGYQLKTESQD